MARIQNIWIELRWNEKSQKFVFEHRERNFEIPAETIGLDRLRANSPIKVSLQIQFANTEFASTAPPEQAVTKLRFYPSGLSSRARVRWQQSDQTQHPLQRIQPRCLFKWSNSTKCSQGMTMQSSKFRHHSGFTLLEVLLATALFAVSSTALVQVVLNTLSAVNAQATWSSDTVDQAFVIDQIAEIDDRDHFEAGGTLTSPSGQVVHWSARNEPTDIIDLHEVEVRLEWQPFNQRPAREVLQKHYWYRPWLSEPSERAARIAAKN